MSMAERIPETFILRTLFLYSNEMYETFEI